MNWIRLSASSLSVFPRAARTNRAADICMYASVVNSKSAHWPQDAQRMSSRTKAAASDAFLPYTTALTSYRLTSPHFSQRNVRGSVSNKAPKLPASKFAR
jgi:hypothetical protein